MDKLKPSKLPKNTVIKDEEHVRWIKDSDILWTELGHCADCENIVSDEGCETPQPYGNGVDISVGEKSDDYFEHFEIMAMGISYVKELHVLLKGENR